MLTLAFYKGGGDHFDVMIKKATRSPYSHVEVITDWDPQEFQEGGCDAHGASASWRDGGVVYRPLYLLKKHWDIVGVPGCSSSAVIDMMSLHLGKPYDLLGAILTQFPFLQRSTKSRWFCSEIVAYGMGLPCPERYSPGDLYALLPHLAVSQPAECSR